MTLDGLIRWAQSGWQIAGPRSPYLLARHLRLIAHNRTSRVQTIKSAPCILEANPADRPNGTPPNGDLVIPVYNNYDDTRQLLDALSRDRSFEGAIIIVHDASPDVRLAPMLRAFAASDPRVRLLENEVNLGFVQTCNRGIAASSADVVILNTDIDLPEGAVGRILRRLQSSPDIASVTPFSNSAYCVGFPDLVYPNALPFSAPVAAIDACVRAMPVASEITLPSGNGFCMGISRAALTKVGAFDEQFGHGYGEETDFCQRAIAQGLRHVLASDVYVGHKGGQSFGASWQYRSREGLLKVLDCHPEFVDRVRVYLENGKARALALAALLRLARERSGKPLIIVREANASVQALPDPETPHLFLARQGREAIATLVLGDERHVFRFAEAEVLHRALRFAGID
ncbi:MAG: glycosyltransferase [Hyphomicrobium sp.]|jgi:GT2 family glycosyltransferase|nr:glycosyltransferase [Hyphomicrobium sp.]